MSIDKAIVKNNFSHAAKNYDEFALVQKLVAKKLCDKFGDLNKNFDSLKMLDLGSGSGFIAKNILSQNINYQIFEIDLVKPIVKNSATSFIQCDMEKLCFKSNSFDIIISSFAIQWLENLEKSFLEFYKILKPGGFFIFALPDESSLRELKNASITSGCNFYFNQLPKRENLENFFKKSDFNLLNFHQETIKQRFLSSIDAIKSIKKIGANYSLIRKQPIRKQQLKKFDNSLKSTSNDRLCEVSWVVNYFILSK